MKSPRLRNGVSWFEGKAGMSERLDGKVAAVTGASRGIGLATARILAERGARVALIARSRSALDDAVAAIGDAAFAVVADVSEPDSVRAAFAEIEREAGRLDLLVNNAAIARLHRVEDASDEDLAATVGTNFLGVLYCTRAAIPLLRASSGVVVNISSEGVRRPFPLLSVYLATKGAVELLSSALSEELRADGIRVTLLRSGASTGGFAQDWDLEAGRRALELWRERGLLEFVGLPMAPEVIAESIVHAATRPPGVGVDLLEIRSSTPFPRQSD
jgi:meso-butanediol dehydrogenase/(S,S)-butanediol dehydrogenase/diacetyl reductase